MDNDFELHRTLGRLEVAVEALTHEVREANKIHSRDLAQMNARIAKLEQWKLWLVAFAAGTTSTIAILGGFVYKLLNLFT